MKIPDIKISHIFFLLPLVVGICLSGCRQPSDAPTDEDRVVVSIGPLAELTRAIAGDSVKVEVFLPAATDPETFEPTVRSMRSLSNARGLLITGLLPFETQLAGKLSASADTIAVASVTDGIAPIFGTHSHHSHNSPHSHNSHNSHLDQDPHVWSSVKNAKVMAANIAAILSRWMPGKAPCFEANNRRLQARLDSLDNAYAEALAPVSGRSFVAWHPSLSYFARDYGLQQLAFNQENKETSVLRQAANIRRAGSQAPLAFFIPTDIPADRAASIARELALQPVAINLMSTQWQATLDSIVGILAAPGLQN